MEKYKKNQLSLEPGGRDVFFKYANGRSSKHINVKFVHAYRKKMEDVMQSKVISTLYSDVPASPSPIIKQSSTNEFEIKYEFYKKHYNLI